MSTNGAQPVDPQLRINLRPLANPLPLGIYAFGIGMLLLAAQSAGWIPAKEEVQVGILLAAFVFPLEGAAALIAFLARDTVAATVLGLFTTSWIGIGLLLITGTPGATSLTLGFYLMAFAVPVLVLSIVAFTGKPLIGVMLVLSGTRAVLYGLYEFTGSIGSEHAAGYVAVAIAGTALYTGTALLLEDLRQRALLPVFRRGAGYAAMHEEPDTQLQRTRIEAGVRQQL